MSFQPVIPLPGLAGWSFLQRTKDRQEQSFTKSNPIRREIEYFEKNFAKIESAEDLVNDRRLLRVVLGAFGLQDDIDYRAFIRKILEGGTDNPSALANRLSDTRYRAFAKAFGHLSMAQSAETAVSIQQSQIISQYISRSFEISVGLQNETMRLALSLQRDLPELVDNFSTEKAQWFALLGNPPIRKILETAFGLPKEFGLLPIDDQYTRLRDSAIKLFGTADLKTISEPDGLARLTERLLLMSEIREIRAMASPAATALFLLQS